jgi:hypothetical protein
MSKSMSTILAASKNVCGVIDLAAGAINSHQAHDRIAYPHSDSAVFFIIFTSIFLLPTFDFFILLLLCTT